MQALLRDGNLRVGTLETWLLARLTNGKVFLAEPVSDAATLKKAQAGIFTVDSKLYGRFRFIQDGMEWRHLPTFRISKRRFGAAHSERGRRIMPNQVS